MIISDQYIRKLGPACLPQLTCNQCLVCGCRKFVIVLLEEVLHCKLLNELIKIHHNPKRSLCNLLPRLIWQGQLIVNKYNLTISQSRMTYHHLEKNSQQHIVGKWCYSRCKQYVIILRRDDVIILHRIDVTLCPVSMYYFNLKVTCSFDVCWKSWYD